MAISHSTRKCAPFGWRSIAETTANRLPNNWARPGCYAIVLDGVVVYIGQSEDVRGRLQIHLRHTRLNIFGRPDRDPMWITPLGNCDTLTLKFKPGRRRGDWLMREYRLLHRLRPRLNKLIPGRVA